MKELTKAEEQIMQILWKIEQGFVKDIIAHFEKPKPAYNTVSTIVRILEKKGFVSHEAIGNSHQYFPLITKETYSRKFLKNFLNGYFSNSFKQLVSFFSKEEELSVDELDEMVRLLQDELEQKKQKQNE